MPGRPEVDFFLESLWTAAYNSPLEKFVSYSFGGNTMKKRGYWILAVGFCVLLLAGSLQLIAESKAQAPGSGAGAKGTYKVSKGTLKGGVAIKGVVEAETMTEIVLRPEAGAGGSLIVKKAVPLGTSVKKGEALVELETDKIDRAIQELEADLRMAEVTLKQAEEDLPILEKSTPEDLKAAERAKQFADEDLKRFLDIDLPLAKESAEVALKNAVFQLGYAKDELRQLEKMYQSKDLTEETEEMILKQQRHKVESAEFALKNAEKAHEKSLKIDLPRREQTMRENAEKQGLALEKAKSTLPLTLSQKKLAFEKAKHEYQKNKEKLEKLRKDRAMMAVTAPVEGIVYYGRCVNGQWTTGAAVASKLAPKGTLSPEEVFMTIVSARSPFVRAQVDEKDLHLVHAGLKGKATLNALPDVKIPAEIVSVASVPHAGSQYEAKVRIEPGRNAENIMPGMNCTLHFVGFERKDVLTVPASAVFTDDAEEDSHYVYLAGQGGGQPQKRAVQTGKTAHGKTEIVSGLSEGDEILLSKP
jgi:multidrug efflux pump subunit AcrA (membrane-fusion protein)